MPKPKPAHGHAVHGKPKPRKNHCFACGKDNKDGMHLKFFLDDVTRHAICKFKLSRKYTGPPGHSHGGIIATILDEAMGKVNRFRNVLALTSSMEIRYLKPVPLGKLLTVTGYEQSVEGRKHTNVAEISNDAGEVLARSTGTFIAIDVEKMFPGQIKGLQGSAKLASPNT
ncbi:MAG TPA: PaaI family thioesterase [Candidatus Angelobacter sp.]|nr:PaaI family thioesterase [Candidatus Angelobacter sp.]